MPWLLTSNRPRLGFWLMGATCLFAAVDAFRPKAGRATGWHATKEAPLPKRQLSAPWRAQNRTIPVARRTVMSLPLIAFILLAGPANGSAGNHINRHVNPHTDIPTTRTTVPSAGARNKGISAGHRSVPLRTELPKLEQAATSASRSIHSSSESAHGSHLVMGPPLSPRRRTRLWRDPSPTRPQSLTRPAVS